jgi:hypothetical protein
MRIPTSVLLLVLYSCGGNSGSRLPSQLSRFPDDLGNAKLEASGIYEDGWADESASVNLEQPRGKQTLAVRGLIPRIADPNFRTDVELRVDDRRVARQAVGIGDFRISAPVESAPGKRRVTLTFQPSQQLPGADGRTVGARLQFLGFKPGQPEEGPADIVHGPDLTLGSGWGALETFRGQTFRWVENDAQVLVAAGKGGHVRLRLQVEPGPGVGKSFLLKLLDASGRQVNALRVDGRKSVDLSAPVEAGKSNDYRLHVDGGGRKTPGDPRILNFRVFRIEAVAAGGS